MTVIARSAIGVVNGPVPRTASAKKSGGIADRKLHGAASDLRDRSRPIARDHVDRPSVRALRTQAHLRLAVRPARLIDYFGGDL